MSNVIPSPFIGSIIGTVFYRDGYKYQLAKDYAFKLPDGWSREVSYIGEFISVLDGWCCLHKGYASDGPSGPTIDTKTFMRGAFEHDGMYQLIRLGIFPPDLRDSADRHLVETCKNSGMSWPRRQWVYYALKHFGHLAADPSSEKEVMTA